MRKGSVLIITLGVIVVLFLISIFILALVNHKLQVLKFEQKKLQANNTARSIGLLVYDNFLKLYNNGFSNIGSEIEIPNPNSNLDTARCIINDIDPIEHIYTVTCYSKVGNINGQITFDIQFELIDNNDYFDFALSLSSAFHSDNQNKEIPQNTEIWGDVLTTKELKEYLKEYIEILDEDDKANPNKINIRLGDLFSNESLQSDFFVIPSISVSDPVLYVNKTGLTVSDSSKSPYNLIDNNDLISNDATFSSVLVNDNNSTLELQTPPFPDSLFLAVGTFDIQEKNNFTIKVKGPKDGMGIAILYIKEGSSTNGKNSFTIETDKNAYLFIYSDNNVQIELMNSGKLQNTYIYLPEGDLIAKNGLTLEGSIFVENLTVGNNTKLRQTDPPDEFREIIEKMVDIKIQFDNPIKDFKLLRWSKWKMDLQL